MKALVILRTETGYEQVLQSIVKAKGLNQSFRFLDGSNYIQPDFTEPLTISLNANLDYLVVNNLSGEQPISNVLVWCSESLSPKIMVIISDNSDTRFDKNLFELGFEFVILYNAKVKSCVIRKKSGASIEIPKIVTNLSSILTKHIKR